MAQNITRVAVKSPPQQRVTSVEVERACGHVEVLEVRGDPTRSTYLDNARLRDCAPCYRAKQTAADEQAVVDGKRCTLDGTEKQIAWAQGVRQRRALDFGKALGEAVAWAKVQAGNAKSGITIDFAKQRTTIVQGAIADLFKGGVTWALLNQDGDEIEVSSNSARWWIDTRELAVRDLIAALTPQFAWERYRDWEPLFRDIVSVEDDAPDAFEGMNVVPAAPVPSRKGAPKEEPLLDDEPF